MDHPNCTACGGRTQYCFNGVSHDPNTIPEIIIVTEQPDFAFSSDKFTNLSRYISQFVDLSKVYWTGGTKCWGKNPEKAFKHCKTFLEYEIEQYKPKLLITVGKSVIKGLFNKVGSKEDIRVRQRVFGSHTLTHTHIHDLEAVGLTPYNGIINQWTLSKIPDVLAGKYPRQVLEGKNYLCYDLNSYPHLQQALEQLPDRHVISLDIETGGKDDNGLAVGFDAWHPSQYIIGIGLSWEEKQAAYIRCPTLPKEVIVGLLNQLHRLTVVCHNGKFDLLTMIKLRYGVDLESALLFDTMLVDHLIREWDRRHSLKFVAALRIPEFDGYDEPVDDWFDSRRIAKDKRDYGDLPDELLEPYCCADAEATRCLYFALGNEYQAQGDALSSALIPHVLRMQAAYGEAEINGWGVNEEYWRQLDGEITTEQQQDLATLQSHEAWRRWIYQKEAELRAKGLVFYDETEDRLYTDSSKQTPIPQGYRHKSGKVIKSRVYTMFENEKVALKKHYLSPKPSNDEFKRTVLFDKQWFGLKPYKLTDKQRIPSADSDSLREAGIQVKDAGQKAFIDALLGYEKKEKLLTTYIRPVYASWLKSDGLIHPGYYLAGNDTGTMFDEGGTNSGRISGKNPNMTNIPSRQGGKRIKKMFVPVPRWFDGQRYETEEPWVILQIDYSQLELRVLADLSSDPFMLAAYQNHEDLHTKLATQQWRQDLAWFEERLNDEKHADYDKANDMRLCSKTSWFSVIYGAGPPKLHQTLLKYGIRNVKEEDCKVMIDDLRSTITVAVQWHRNIKMHAPIITTRFGRRRHAIDYYSSDDGMRQKAERQLGNFIIQSTGSDLFSLGFYSLREWLKSERELGHIRTYPNGTVHDSVILSAPLYEVDYVCYHAKRILENLPLPWQPQLVYPVDIEFGPNWGELQKWRGA